jgi:hypothetical protein
MKGKMTHLNNGKEIYAEKLAIATVRRRLKYWSNLQACEGELSGNCHSGIVRLP